MLFLLRYSLIFLILARPEFVNASLEALPPPAAEPILPSPGNLSMLSLFLEKLMLRLSNATELFFEPKPFGLYFGSETKLFSGGALAVYIGVYSLVTSCKFSVNF